jgi:hypothetical protein
MVFKKIYGVALLLSITLAHAAASSSQGVATFDEAELQARRRQLHDMAQAAIFSNPEDDTALNKIIAWRAEGNSRFFNMSDKNGVKPFFWAINWMHKLSRDVLFENSEYYARVIRALNPMIEQDSEDKQVSDFMHELLNGDSQQFKDACAKFADLSSRQQDQVRERYLVATGGHYIEPLLMKNSVRMILNKCIGKKTGVSGFEKIYAVGLLKYILSPLYHKSIDRSLLNAVLVCCALREQHMPSFVPTLMRAKANPCEAVKLDNNSNKSALQCVLTRLGKRPLERGYATKLLLEMLPSVPKSNHAGLLLYFGRFGQNLTADDYMQHWESWLRVCVGLGVDLQKLRRLVFPFLKHTIANKQEYIATKVVRHELRLSDVEKFAFACLVHEFAHVLASALKADDVMLGRLNTHIVYDLPAYIYSGELIAVHRDAESIRIDAERYRSKLSCQANDLVAHMARMLYVKN